MIATTSAGLIAGRIITKPARQQHEAYNRSVQSISVSLTRLNIVEMKCAIILVMLMSV
ncbi:MAG: hypothetical protein K2I26_00780 [Paramuribaculum sp.]|nr:hypothetical protein [Paramuribaculum sp.]